VKKQMMKINLIIATALGLIISACLNNPKTIAKSDQDTQKVTSSRDTHGIKPDQDKQEIKKDIPVTARVTNVPYTIAEKYFIKNTVTNIDIPKIETSEKFNEYFGAATTMGLHGKPTQIDFTWQYVIAMTLPSTNYLTTIKPVSLQKNDKGEIVLTYKIEKGEKQSFSTKPGLAIIVDKSNDGTVVLREQK
jgi:hypothetical protein